MSGLEANFAVSKMVVSRALQVLLVVLPFCAGKILKECKEPNSCYDELMHPDIDVPPVETYSEEEKTSDFWLNSSKVFVEHQLKRQLNKNVAKNVIFFIGDGMSLATIAASRLLLGGEEKSLYFENFPYTGLVKTYCLDKTVPDSASTATSYLRGVKANYGTIGVDGRVKRKDCEGMLDEKTHVYSIAKWAMDAGKFAGLVTTTRVTHASPAGVYAHTADRDWENDSIVKATCGSKKVLDIADQLVHGDVGSRLKVILGGGRREFRDIYADPEEGRRGARSDGRDLINEWLAKAGRNENRTYVYNRDQLLRVDAMRTDKLLGLFQDTHMLYHLEAEEQKLGRKKPTLVEMTTKAIELLQKNDKGYFLFVEGGKIDLAHHKVQTRLALDETIELSKAVEAARKMTNSSDTLIVVSSDHSHTMTISGYPRRHNDIFQVAKTSDKDYLPYITLSYANGKGFSKYYDTKRGKRINPLKINRKKIKAQFPSTVPLNTETHGGEDVAVFASGPFDHLFTGVYEQNVLPHLMAYAACIGDGHKACD